MFDFSKKSKMSTFEFEFLLPPAKIVERNPKVGEIISVINYLYSRNGKLISEKSHIAKTSNANKL